MTLASSAVLTRWSPGEFLRLRALREASKLSVPLSAARGLIKRFSEDIDFKVATPAASSNSQARSLRRRYRENVLAEPLVGNVGNFSSANVAYPSEFVVTPGLRPHLRVEMSFRAPTLPPI
jgi:Nucleotidyl transferase AbiEii toxin, Type IV TA system